MRRYRVVQPLVLAFMGPREQVDCIIRPEDGGWVECDGSTVWYVDAEGRHESITTVDIIPVALRRGSLVDGGRIA